MDVLLTLLTAAVTQLTLYTVHPALYAGSATADPPNQTINQNKTVSCLWVTFLFTQYLKYVRSPKAQVFLVQFTSG